MCRCTRAWAAHAAGTAARRTPCRCCCPPMSVTTRRPGVHHPGQPGAGHAQQYAQRAGCAAAAASQAGARRPLWLLLRAAQRCSLCVLAAGALLDTACLYSVVSGSAAGPHPRCVNVRARGCMSCVKTAPRSQRTGTHNHSGCSSLVRIWRWSRCMTWLLPVPVTPNTRTLNTLNTLLQHCMNTCTRHTCPAQRGLISHVARSRLRCSSCAHSLTAA
jgi:hypothetical protein